MVWFVGRVSEDTQGEDVPRWELLGVYSQESLAVARCRQAFDFVAPATLDVDAPEEPTGWPGLYFPLAPSP